jgi:hypothetical protein
VRLGKDKWGVSWQITPRVLTEALAAGGAEAKRAFDAMMGMKKIDVAAIKAARLMFKTRTSSDRRVLARLSRRGCETIRISSGITATGKWSDVAAPLLHRMSLVVVLSRHRRWAECPLCARSGHSMTSSARAHRAHSGNPAFRRPSINSFAFDCPPRAIYADIVKAGSRSSTSAAASRASAPRPRWAKAHARQR